MKAIHALVADKLVLHAFIDSLNCLLQYILFPCGGKDIICNCRSIIFTAYYNYNIACLLLMIHID